MSRVHGVLILPKRLFEWRVDSHGCYKFNNATPRHVNAYLSTLSAVTSESSAGQLCHPIALILRYFVSSLCLCLCLCQTNLHLLCQQQRRLSSRSLRNSGTPAFASMSVCAVSSTRSSWVLHRPTACGLHCPFAAAAVTKSRSK